MFESLSETRSYRGTKSTNLRFVFNAEKKGKYVTVHIPYKHYSAAGISKGDKVDVLIDRVDNRVMLKKVASDSGQGWKLGRSNGETALKFKYTVFQDCPMPTAGKKESIIKKVEYLPESIAFDMPESLRFYSVK